MNGYEAIAWGLIILGVIVMAYGATRAIAVAWFRTKLEYFRSVMREGGHNGEG